jgi:hypothetical protein
VSLLRQHVVMMFLYALATGAFFSLLWKRERAERVRYFLFVFFALFLGGIALGWAMYALPVK